MIRRTVPVINHSNTRFTFSNPYDNVPGIPGTFSNPCDDVPVIALTFSNPCDDVPAIALAFSNPCDDVPRFWGKEINGFLNYPLFSYTLEQDSKPKS